MNGLNALPIIKQTAQKNNMLQTICLGTIPQYFSILFPAVLNSGVLASTASTKKKICSKSTSLHIEST